VRRQPSLRAFPVRDWLTRDFACGDLAQHARYGGDAYNDYPSYLRVLDALARFVEDADFAMRFEQEDDAGDDYYVVDACRIHGGALSVIRRLTRMPERSEGAG
jgi:hypothetical protein